MDPMSIHLQDRNYFTFLVPKEFVKKSLDLTWTRKEHPNKQIIMQFLSAAGNA